MDASKNISFSIDKGLYRLDTIEEFDEIQMFTEETQLILSTIVRNITKEDETGRSHKIIDGKLNIERVFPTFHGLNSKILGLTDFHTLDKCAQ